MGKFTRFTAALCLLLLATGAAAEPAWVGSWGASPLPPRQAFGPFPATPAFSNQTVREVVRLSLGGRQIRLRLTNEYGKKPLHIGAVTVARAGDDGGIVAGTRHSVTFSGRRTAIIPAGAPLLSDPVDLKVSDLDSLSISIYLPEDTGQCTCHPVGLETAYVSAPGDYTGKDFKPASTLDDRLFLSEVDVRAEEPAHSVVAFGDSITDGYRSTRNMNRRWPDLLAGRLAARGREWGVVNAGISGNQVLRAGAGESALTRFDRDVLSVPGVAAVIIFEGINDIGARLGSSALLKPLPGDVKLTAAGLIAGYRQLIARAHAKGLKVYVATITPYQGAAYYSDQGEAVRTRVNKWIRTSGEADAVLDFDKVWRAPAHPARIRQSLQAGDNLHGNDAGYRALADSIDLKLFNN